MLERPPGSFAAAACAAVAWMCCGCGSDPQCVIDTDCDALQVCNADNECVPRSGAVDASFDGARPDAGDAGVDAPVEAQDGGTDGGGIVGTGNLTATSNRDLPGPDASTTSEYNVTATFAYTAEGDESCTTETLGPCTVTECAPPPSPDGGMADGGTDAGMMDAGTPPPPPTAGNIQVSGGTIDPVSLMPSGDVYPPQMGTQALWTAAGTALMAQAGHRPFEEEEVPMFTASVQTPIDVTIEAPDLSASPTTIDPATPLEVQWSGTSSVGSLKMHLSGPGPAEGETTSATCTFEVDSDAVTMGTVSRTVLTRFGTGPGSLSFIVESSSTTEVDGWQITFTARSFAKTTTGAKATTGVMLN